MFDALIALSVLMFAVRYYVLSEVDSVSLIYKNILLLYMKLFTIVNNSKVNYISNELMRIKQFMRY